MPIKNCSCKDDWCDKTYGPGKRVCNETKDGGYRCATCSSKQLPKGDKRK